MKMDYSMKGETYQSLRMTMNVFIIFGILTMTGIKLKTRTCYHKLRTIVLCLFAFVSVGIQLYLYGKMLYHIGKRTWNKLLELQSSSLGRDNMVSVTDAAAKVMYFVTAIWQTTLYWVKGKDIRRYLKEIDQYEIGYTDTTGHQIANPLRKGRVLILMVFVSAVGYTYASVYWYLQVFKGKDYLQLFYRSDYMMRLYTEVIFCLLCKVLSDLALQFRRDFMYDIRNGMSETRLNHYGSLRFKLAALVNTMRNTMGVIYYIHLLQELSMIYLNSYATVLNIGWFYDKFKGEPFRFRLLLHLKSGPFKKSPVVLLLYTMMKFCVSTTFAHNVESQMGYLLKEDLLTQMYEFRDNQFKMHQLKIFAKRIMSSPAHISIVKHLHLNKAFFCKVFFALIYYTCTFLQFYDAFTLFHGQQKCSQMANVTDV